MIDEHLLMQKYTIWYINGKLFSGRKDRQSACFAKWLFNRLLQDNATPL
jgi:hypothetical protein